MHSTTPYNYSIIIIIHKKSLLGISPNQGVIMKEQNQYSKQTEIMIDLEGTIECYP